MRLEEFVEINPKVELEKGERYPRIMMSQVTPGRRYVFPEDEQIYGGGGSRFISGDTLFARITPCLENGKIAQFRGFSNQPGFGSTEFFVFRAKQGVSDPGFVYYLSQTNTIRKPAEKSMFGASGRQRVDLDAIKSLEIVAPPLPVQCKIAGILSNHDNLIENLIHRAQIVEEMAHAIYVEWFVRFHFPGHETVQMVESGTELGRIPHGWEAVPFSEAVKVNPKIDVDRAAIKPYVSMSGISTSSMVIECDEYRSGSSGSKFQNDDVIFPRITPSVEHGKGAYVQFLDGGQVGLGSTEFIVFRPDRLPSQYIYFLSREYAFRENAIKSMVGASGRQRVRMECFDSFLVAMPSPELLSMYSDLTRPHFRYIHSLNLSRSRIQGARDLLLPKLVSCEVELVSI